MARDEDRLATRGQGLERVAQLHDPARVQAVGRLVEQEELGVVEQRNGDAEPLLHPHRVSGDAVACPIAQAHQFEKLFDAGLSHGPTGRAHDPQVFARREVRVERRRFDQGAHVVEDVAPRTVEALAEERDRARVGADEPGQQAHRRRLAGAVGSQETVDHAARDFQVETGQGRLPAVRLLKTAGRKGQCRRCGHGLPCV